MGTVEQWNPLSGNQPQSSASHQAAAEPLQQGDAARSLTEASVLERVFAAGLLNLSDITSSQNPVWAALRAGSICLLFVGQRSRWANPSWASCRASALPRGDQGTCCCCEIAARAPQMPTMQWENIFSRVFIYLSRESQNWRQDWASVESCATKEGAKKGSGKLSSSKLMCSPQIMFRSKENNTCFFKKIIPLFTHTEVWRVGSIFQIHTMWHLLGIIRLRGSSLFNRNNWQIDWNNGTCNSTCAQVAQ